MIPSSRASASRLASCALSFASSAAMACGACPSSKETLRATACASSSSPPASPSRYAPSLPPSTLINWPICLPTTTSPTPLSRNCPSMSSTNSSVSRAECSSRIGSFSMRKSTMMSMAVIMSNRPATVSAAPCWRYHSGSRAISTIRCHKGRSASRGAGLERNRREKKLMKTARLRSRGHKAPLHLAAMRLKARLRI